MKLFILILFLNTLSILNAQTCKKDITFENIDKPTLVQLELDNEIYKNSKNSFADIRLRNSKNEIEGYFIRSFKRKFVENTKTLTASSYNRKKGELIYKFNKPFDIENIKLNIEDINFESTVDIYANGKQLLSNYKIFDYSNETGTSNFTVKIPKVNTKEIKIIYHLDKTTSFYKKYQKLKEMSQYLTIKSVSFSNNNKSKIIWNSNKIAIKSTRNIKEDKKTEYIFDIKNIPFSKIRISIKEKNFKRNGDIYISNDGFSWQYIKRFSFFSSTITKENNVEISTTGRAKYLKLLISNGDNKQLTVNNLNLLSPPNYLYFIANTSEKYALYFCNKDALKPNYELESLINKSVDNDKNIDFIKGTVSELETLKQINIAPHPQQSFLKSNKELLFMLAMITALLVMGYVAFILVKNVEKDSDN